MVMDHYWERWNRQPLPVPTVSWTQPMWPLEPNTPVDVEPIKPVFPTLEEIAEFRRLLKRAREYDAKNNEPDCELAEKKQRLSDLAKELGVEISFD